MKKFIGYIAGVVTGMLLVSVPIFADGYSKALDALVNYTTVKINGVAVESDNFVVDGKTYVWIRDVAGMFGKQVIWEEKNNTVNLADADAYIAAEEDSEVVASAGDTQITRGQLVSASLMNPDGATNGERLQNALDREIEAAVTLREAAKNGFTADDETVAAVQEYLKEFRGYYRENVAQMLAGYRLDEAAFIAYLEKTLILDNFRKYLMENTEFPEDALRAKYAEMIDDFQTAVVKHILIQTEGRTDDEAKAEIQKIAGELKTAAQFDALMAQYSEDSATKDNTEGFEVKKGTMVAEFEAASFGQEVGVIGEPVKTAYGYHIVLVTERAPEAFETVRNVCGQALFADWYEAQVQAWKAETPIEINTDLVERLSAE
ncbi:MAG: peptidylprolyl isomerase [Clostridiales bacterium]|jgi:parvulin-like peptidyl-prolyl isomerase|nr:peptidylprolyl isomerase [Clostridiales bacterium]